MFKRELTDAPSSIVHNGKVCFGTFSNPTQKLDIRGARRPFADVPLPSFITNLRIKCTLTYAFRVSDYLGFITIFDDKIFGLAEVVLWDISSEPTKRISYHAFMPMRRKFIPTDTQIGSSICFASTRYIKIVWNKKRKSLHVTFVMAGDRWRQASKGKFFSRLLSNKNNEMMAVSPAPTTKRCSAVWIVPSLITGGVAFAKHRRQIKGVSQDKGQSLFLMKRIYLKWHTVSEEAWGFCNINNKNIAFHLEHSSQSSTIDEDFFNENMLSEDSEITALPAVFITHPYGQDKDWIIQDTENMVDLVFTPINTLKRVVNIILMRNAYSIIYGKFNGVLLTAAGEKVELKNCPGIVKRSVLRL